VHTGRRAEASAFYRSVDRAVFGCSYPPPPRFVYHPTWTSTLLIFLSPIFRVPGMIWGAWSWQRPGCSLIRGVDGCPIDENHNKQLNFDAAQQQHALIPSQIRPNKVKYHFKSRWMRSLRCVSGLIRRSKSIPHRVGPSRETCKLSSMGSSGALRSAQGVFVVAMY